MKYLLARLSEPSTWASLCGLAAVVGVHVPVPQVQAVAAGVGALAGLAGVFAPEAAAKAAAVAEAAASGVGTLKK